MGPLDAVWHLLNLFAPALGVGCITPVLAKLLWRRSLQGSLWRLCAWTTLGGALGVLLALVVFGRDGRMAGYGLVVALAAIALWWTGLRRAPTN